MKQPLLATFSPLILMTLFLVEAVTGLAVISTETAEAMLPFLIWCGVLGLSYFLLRTAKLQLPEDEEKQKVFVVIGAMLLFVFILLGWLPEMVLLLIAFMNPFIRQTRELYILLLSTFALLLYGAAQSFDSLYVALMALYTFFVIWLLMLLYTHHRIAANAHTEVLGSSSGYFRTAALLLSVLTGMTALLLYLLTPRPEPFLLGSLNQSGDLHRNSAWDGRTKTQRQTIERGLADTISAISPQDPLKGIQYLQKAPATTRKSYDGMIDTTVTHPANNLGVQGTASRVILFYVKGPVPTYLRGKVFDTFDQGTWRASLQEKRLLPLRYGVARFETQESDGWVDYQITVNTPVDGEPVIFTPVPYHIIEFPSYTAAIDGYATLYAPETIKRKSFYTVTVDQPAPTGYVLPQARLNDRDRYLKIPKALQPAIHTVLQKAVKAAKDERDTVRQIQLYLRNHYAYNRRFMQNQNNTPTLESFLLQKKRGHCKYFATSAVMLLRAAKIPARYITGFAPTPLNPVTGYYEVRSDTAHAWAEAWIDGTWIQVEATPESFCTQCASDGLMSESLQTYVQHLNELPGIGTFARALLGTFEEALDSLNAIIRWIAVYLGNALRDYGDILLLLIVATIAGRLLWRRYREQLLHYYRIRKILQKLAALENKNAPPRSVITDGYALLEEFLQLTATGRNPAWTPEKYCSELKKRHHSIDKTSLEQIFHEAQLLFYADRIPDGFDARKYMTNILLVIGSFGVDDVKRFR